MMVWAFLLLGAASAPAVENQLLNEINSLRRDPVAYAAHLAEYKGWMDGRILRVPGVSPLETQEGAAAVEEAIRVLRRSKPMRGVTTLDPLIEEARMHARDQGFTGNVGHSRNGVAAFMGKYNLKGWAQNISYGPADPRLTVIELLVDDGVRDRGHRKNLLDPRFSRAGVACAPHRVYGRVCVMNFAAE